MGFVSCELLWLQRVLAELQKPMNSSMKLYCDNKATISIAYNPKESNIN